MTSNLPDSSLLHYSRLQPPTMSIYLAHLWHQHTHSIFQVVNFTCTGTNSCLINHKEIMELIMDCLEVNNFDLYKRMGLFAMPVGCRDATKYLEIAYECIPPGGWYSFNANFEKLWEGYWTMCWSHLSLLLMEINTLCFSFILCKWKLLLFLQCLFQTCHGRKLQL